VQSFSSGRTGVEGGGHGEAEADGLQEGEGGDELLGVAQDGEAGPGGDHRAEQVTAGGGDA
jgi:hypothetical protein